MTCLSNHLFKKKLLRNCTKLFYLQFSVPSLVIDAQLQSSRHRAAHTSAEFDIDFLKLCSDLSLQFMNGTRLFTINKVFHEPPKKEIWRCKVWGACRPLDRTAAADQLSGKVFIKPLTNITSIMRWSSIMLEITVLILYPGPKEVCSISR